MGGAITGWGTAVPRATLSNEDLASRLGIDSSWIAQRTGIKIRHIAGLSETTASLAAEAGRNALRLAEADPISLDAIVVATVTPDFKLPATACLVQAALGADNTAAFDLNAGCSGFLYALAQATAMVDAGSCRKVLVIGADVLSRITDYTDSKSCVLFGDGAGAVLVEKREGGGRLGPFFLRADGRDPTLLWAPPETGLIAMDGREVYRRAVDAMSRSVEDLCAAQGIHPDEIDLLVAHQANARILAAVAERVGLPADKVMSNIASYGNTSAASIPLALAEAVGTGRLTDGDLVMLTSFGAGFTWGAGLVRWGVWAHEVRSGSLEVESVV
jgi:3-oxoacyl-[acyl-carrier-protein] synthase-3